MKWMSMGDILTEILSQKLKDRVEFSQRDPNENTVHSQQESQADRPLNASYLIHDPLLHD